MSDSTTTSQLSSLTPGTALEQGTRYVSNDGKYFLLFQTDGNLVVSDAATAKSDIWGLHQVFRDSTGTIDTSRCLKGRSAKFEADGSLAVYDEAGSVAWTSPAGGSGLRLENDGQLTLLNGGSKVWGSNGWRSSKSVGDTGITVLASRAATNQALTSITGVYTRMMELLKLDKEKMRGFSIYVVNGEDWDLELAALSPINGHDWDGNPEGTVGDQAILRGGMCVKFCWVDEDLLCGTGPDGETRTFDQVIHEFAHGIAGRCRVDDKNINSEWKLSVNPADSNPSCGWAWAVQHWFSSPDAPLTPTMTEFLGKVFSGKATFACP